MGARLAVVINKDGGDLGASETFLHAHINQMPCHVYSLIGNPGFRKVRDGSEGPGHYLDSRALIPLAFRWGLRHVLGHTVAGQDTRALRQFLTANNIDAVLAEYGPTAVTVMEACKQAGVPLIAQFHGYDAYRESVVEELGQGYRQLFESAAAIVGVSSHMCEKLRAMGAPEGKLFHNACGAEVSGQASAAPAEAGPRFVMVGRLVEKKAPFVSLLAFARVAAEFPEAELEVVGDGPLMAPCQQLSKALGIEGRVTFAGARPHSYVMSALTKARCFIQHSVRAPDGDMEGTPVGVLEAMGMGLPVVSTRHGGIRDIISEGETGLLVDEYDAEVMSAAMKALAGKPEYAADLGSKARQSVLENWTTEKSVGRLWDIIQKTC
ncbi:MAG TPA: glycosyl transferase family 1 [Marinobacter sp.]|nr:glycosyl transferase family 1 [Marinobacter sp.]